MADCEHQSSAVTGSVTLPGITLQMQHPRVSVLAAWHTPVLLQGQVSWPLILPVAISV